MGSTCKICESSTNPLNELTPDKSSQSGPPESDPMDRLASQRTIRRTGTIQKARNTHSMKEPAPVVEHKDTLESFETYEAGASLKKTLRQVSSLAGSTQQEIDEYMSKLEDQALARAIS